MRFPFATGGYKIMRKNVNWKMPFVSALLAVMLVLPGCGAKEEAVDENGAYATGMTLLEQGNLNEALAQFKTAVDQEDHVVESYRGEGIVYLQEGTYTSAITMFTRCLDALEDGGDNDAAFREDVLLYEAEAYMKNNNIDEAISIYSDLTSGENPEKAYLMRGIAYVTLGDVDSAKQDFDKVVKTAASYENCIHIYEALASVSRKADGVEYLQKALEQTPETADDYYNEGVVYYTSGNLEQAKEDLNHAIELGSSDAVEMLGKVCIELGETEAAREAYQNMINDGMFQAAAYNGLALCDIADEQYQAALDEINIGLQDTSDPDATKNLLYNQIVAYEKLLDFETAKAKMTEYLAMYPGDENAIRENKFLSTR